MYFPLDSRDTIPLNIILRVGLEGRVMVLPAEHLLYAALIKIQTKSVSAQIEFTKSVSAQVVVAKSVSAQIVL